MTKNLPKVNLDLLKKLVADLESALQATDKMSIRTEDNNGHELVLELAKATGIAVTITQEATMLVGDIQSLVKMSQSPAASSSASKVNDILGELLGFSKPGKNGGTSN